ncbi:MAG: YceI family protein [Thermomicrobiales bacterium]
MATYRIVPERSSLTIVARSSIHPIEGETDGLTGSIEAEFADGRLDLTTAPTLHLEVPVDRLKSGNPLYDGEMQRRIDARRYPTIVADAREVRALDEDGRYHVRGDLTFHGVTEAIEGELQVSSPDERTLVVKGERGIDVRQFNVNPPKVLMLRVDPEITARLHVVAERVDGA